MLRLFYFTPIWTIHTIMWVLLGILGWVLVPPAILFKQYEHQISPITGENVLQFKWWWLLPWSNWGDGIFEGLQYKKFDSTRWQIFWWTLIRNPVNNVRFFPLMGVKPDPKKIKYIGSSKCVTDSSNDDAVMWYLCWQGLRGGFRKHIKFKTFMLRIMFGWKLRPEDTLGVVNEIRKQKVGFAYQFRRSRKL